MTPPIAAVAGSPTWRRGTCAVLADLGFESVEFESLESWTPGVGGAGVVVWVDARTPLSDVAAFTDRHPLIPLVTVLAQVDVVAAAASIRAGALGVVDSSDSIEDLGESIRSAMAGRVSLPPKIATSMADRIPERGTDDWVTPEQVSWLVALAEGVTVAELAERIGWSERETFRMLGDLYRHLGVANRTEAIIWAARQGLVG